MVVAPYSAGAEGGRGASVVGAIGVIGPTRMNYARIIPMVDYTARRQSAPGHTRHRDEAMTHRRKHDEAADEDAAGGQRSARPCRGGARSREQAAPSAEEFQELKDRLLRTLAEMENLRRRTQREVEEARKFAVPPASPATCSRSRTTSPGRWRRSPPRPASRASS